MAYFNNKRIMLACAYEAGANGTLLKPYLDISKSTNKAFLNYTGTNVDDIISYNDTENVEDMSYMFQNCTNLTSVPNLNTSNVTTMQSMFYGCSSITSIPSFNTSNVTNMAAMFQECTNLTTIPTLNTSNVTTFNSMFRFCRNLTAIPLMNTSNVTGMTSAFEGCSNLVSIPALDVSNVTRFDSSGFYCFGSCSKLEEIHMYGMKASFRISYSTRFTESALVEILNNLATVTSTQTLNMGATNLAKLTQAEKDIALNKGWTLA